MIAARKRTISPVRVSLSPLRRTVRYSNHAQPDLPQVTKLRRCGVGVVNSSHVLQAHGSDALLRLYTDVGYAWISAQAFSTAATFANKRTGLRLWEGRLRRAISLCCVRYTRPDCKNRRAETTTSCAQPYSPTGIDA